VEMDDDGVGFVGVRCEGLGDQHGRFKGDAVQRLVDEVDAVEMG